MAAERVSLVGEHIRLEALDGSRHSAGLLAAALEDPSLYQWSLVPRSEGEVARYVETALAWEAAGTAVCFAIVRVRDGAVIGSTRFWNLERWAWPVLHAECGARVFDAGEIGHTWLARSAIRTAANTEAKLLMLTQAFEGRRMLRAHRMAADYTERDSARFRFWLGSGVG